MWRRKGRLFYYSKEGGNDVEMPDEVWMGNEALTVLRKKPDNGERLYNLIYTTYIAPDVLNHQEILYRLTLSSRNYYRLRQQAISVLSIRLWATAAPDVDFWLEMLTLIEGLE